jgi:hypothetical protein
VIRRTAYYSAHGEGWALYSETLADEIGAYRDNPLGPVGHAASAALPRDAAGCGHGHPPPALEPGAGYGRIRPHHGLSAGSGAAGGRPLLRVAGPGDELQVGHNEWVRLREKARTQLAPATTPAPSTTRRSWAGSVPLTVLETVVDSYIAGGAAGVSGLGLRASD